MKFKTQKQVSFKISKQYDNCSCCKKFPNGLKNIKVKTSNILFNFWKDIPYSSLVMLWIQVNELFFQLFCLLLFFTGDKTCCIYIFCKVRFGLLLCMLLLFQVSLFIFFRNLKSFIIFLKQLGKQKFPVVVMSVVFEIFVITFVYISSKILYFCIKISTCWTFYLYMLYTPTSISHAFHCMIKSH